MKRGPRDITGFAAFRNGKYPTRTAEARESR